MALAAPALLVIASCSQDDGLGKRYPVSGTVTYNGKPLEKGIISFVSEDLRDNIGASGEIKNGSYKLSTGGDEDGAQAGKYKVTITAKEDFRAKAQADFRKETGPGESTYIPPQYVAKAEAAAKSLIPAGYGDPSTTTLTAEVKPTIEHDRLPALRRRRTASRPQRRRKARVTSDRICRLLATANHGQTGRMRLTSGYVRSRLQPADTSRGSRP